MIRPTNGRQVWFYPNGTFLSVDGDKGQPLAATVVHVWSDNCVNLQVLDAEGRAIQATSVRLLADGETPPAIGAYCDWMPFQKGQAKAQETIGGGGPPVPAHVERMKVELQELMDRTAKLGSFICGDGRATFDGLTQQEQQLLVDQYEAMKRYQECLSARYLIAIPR